MTGLLEIYKYEVATFGQGDRGEEHKDMQGQVALRDVTTTCSHFSICLSEDHVLTRAITR